MMTTTVVAVTPNPIPSPNAGEGDESDETEAEHKNKAGAGGVIQPSNNNNDIPLIKEEADDDPEQEDQRSESSSAHTDSENDDQEESVKFSDKRKAQEEMNVNDLMTLERNESLTVTEERHAEVLVKVRNLRPPTPGSPRLSISSTNNNRKKLKESCEEDTSSDDDLNSDHGKGSYMQLRLRRKTLLKIEKFTDSDSRSRERMRSRALSPPTSSDEENLHIGWVAYPAALSSPRDHSRRNSHHRGQRAACACAHALKCIFSPVTKVCQKCRVNNKVWDSESLQEKLLNKDGANDNEGPPFDKKLDI